IPLQLHPPRVTHRTITTPSPHKFFFFNDTATTEIYTLSLHDALPISPGRARRRRSPWSRPAGRCRAPRCGSFWGKLRVGAGGPGAGTPPAHLLGPQDPPDLAAPPLEATLPGTPGEGIQRPLRRALLPLSGQPPGPVAHQPPRRHRAGQRDDRRPVRLGDPPLASRTGPVTQPVDAGGVEPVQPAAHRVLMAANLGRDPPNTQPVPAQRDDPGPLDPVRRGMPGTRKPADLPGLAAILRRARL